ncbi:MAG: pantoate--beta-alanine ligase [Chitinophagaceae bacterium]
MILFKKVAAFRKWLDAQQEEGNYAGFVPTMGALHSGHISLVETSRQENPFTVCSIFVNPTQFNDPKDFTKYPVTIEKDILLLEAAGCDVLFLPEFSEIYPNGTKQSYHYELGFLETILEGKFRPGHFQGVCMVVHRLLDIVQPSNLYLGQKDYQQCMVITKLVGLIGKQQEIKLRICPTLREAGGLAMSSRNMRLSKEEKETAVLISQSLTMIRQGLLPGNIIAIQQQASTLLEKAGFKIDYVEIADAATLSPVKVWDGKTELVALVAAYLHEVRLIDNMLLN